MTSDATPGNQYAAWWLFKRGSAWRALANGGYEETSAELANLLDHPGAGITIRGVYTALGLSPDADLIIWAHAVTLEQLQQFAIALDKTSLGANLDVVANYIGVGGMSQYDPTHGPAFIKGLAPKDYLSVYPFSKTPDWYLVNYKERQRLMIEHGEMGREYPDILTNTVNSFGIQTQEFVVALEDDDPEQLVKMVQRLRAAEVRKWTAVDTPIFLGRRKAASQVLADLRGR
jgi:hydrogen peroxide-dependent heme synthase